MDKTNTEFGTWSTKVKELYLDQILAKRLKYRYCEIEANGKNYELDGVYDLIGNPITMFIEEV